MGGIRRSGRVIYGITSDSADRTNRMTDFDRPPDDLPVHRMRNLGTASAQMLASIDVISAGDIRRLGADVVFMMLRDGRLEPSLNLLYAMAAGLEGRHWLDLSEDERAALRQSVEGQNDR